MRRAHATLLVVLGVASTAWSQTPPSRSGVAPPIHWDSGGDTPGLLWFRHDDAGWRALDRQQYATAEHEFIAAINVTRSQPSAIQAKNLAQTYAGLAIALHRQGRNQAALPLARWTITVREQEPGGATSATLAGSLALTGAIERALGHPAEAESMIRRSLAIHERLDPVDSVEVANQLTTLAQILSDQRRYAEAESMAETAASIRDPLFGPTHDDTLVAVATLGLARFAQGKDDAALGDLRRVIVGHESRRKPAPPAALLAVADIQGRRGQSSEAEAGYRKALQQLEANPGPTAPATNQARRRYAAWLDRVGRSAEARTLTTSPPAPPASAAPVRPGPA